MKRFPYLLLTILLAGGPAFMADPAAAENTRHDAVLTLSDDAPASILMADSRHGGHHFGTRHGGRNDHFRHPGFSHDRHFGRHDHRRFLGHDSFRGHDRHFFRHDQRNFHGHDRHFFGKNHRHFRDDRLFFGHDKRHDDFFGKRHPHAWRHVPGVTVCYRSGSVLVCYGG